METFLCARTRRVVTVDTSVPLDNRFGEARWHNHTKHAAEQRDCFASESPGPVRNFVNVNGQVWASYDKDPADSRGYKETRPKLAGRIDIGMDRDPVNNSGVCRNEHFLCCGQPLSDPGCFFDVHSRRLSKSQPYKIVRFDPYAMLLGVGFDPADPFAPGPLSVIRDRWNVSRVRGTAWLDANYYNGIHNDIVTAMSLVATSIARGFAAFLGDPQAIETFFHAGTLNRLVKVYSLVAQYNQYRCQQHQNLPGSPVEWLAFLMRVLFRPELRYAAIGETVPDAVASRLENLHKIISDGVPDATVAGAQFTNKMIDSITEVLASPVPIVVVRNLPPPVAPPKGFRQLAPVPAPAPVPPAALTPTTLVPFVAPLPPATSQPKGFTRLTPVPAPAPVPPAALTPTTLVPFVAPASPGLSKTPSPPASKLSTPPLSPPASPTTPGKGLSPGSTAPSSPFTPPAPVDPSSPPDSSELPPLEDDPSFGGASPLPVLPAPAPAPAPASAFKIAPGAWMHTPEFDKALQGLQVADVASIRDIDGQRLLSALKNLTMAATQMSQAAAVAQTGDGQVVFNFHQTAFQATAATVLATVYDQVLLSYVGAISAKDEEVALAVVDGIETVLDLEVANAPGESPARVPLSVVLSQSKERVIATENAKKDVVRLESLVADLVEHEDTLRDEFLDKGPNALDRYRVATKRVENMLLPIMNAVDAYEQTIDPVEVSAEHIAWIRRVKTEVEAAIAADKGKGDDDEGVVPPSPGGDDAAAPPPTVVVTTVPATVVSAGKTPVKEPGIAGKKALNPRNAWLETDARVVALKDLAARAAAIGGDPKLWSADGKEFDWEAFRTTILLPIVSTISGTEIDPKGGPYDFDIDPEFFETLYAGNEDDASEFGVLFGEQPMAGGVLLSPAKQSGFIRTMTVDKEEIRKIVVRWVGVPLEDVVSLYDMDTELGATFVPRSQPGQDNSILIGKLGVLLATFVNLFIKVKTADARTFLETKLRSNNIAVLKGIHANLKTADGVVHESPEKLILALVAAPQPEKAFGEWTLKLMAEPIQLHTEELDRLKNIGPAVTEGLEGREKVEKGVGAVLKKVAEALLTVEHKSFYTVYDEGSNGAVLSYQIDSRVNKYLIMPLLYAYQEVLLYLGKQRLLKELQTPEAANKVAAQMGDRQLAMYGISIFNQIVAPEVQVDMGLIVPVHKLEKGAGPGGKPGFVIRMSIGRGLSTSDSSGMRVYTRKLSIADQTTLLHRWGHLAVILSAILSGSGVTKHMVNAVSSLRVPSSAKRDADVKALSSTSWVSSDIVGSVFGEERGGGGGDASTDDISNWE
jgi:hypothetical protein